ncbi:MAG: hypothetical protein AB2771_19955, partial [Candidatus Thiodiazotropha endolucinida]
LFSLSYFCSLTIDERQDVKRLPLNVGPLSKRLLSANEVVFCSCPLIPKVIMVCLNISMRNLLGTTNCFTFCPC